MRAGGKKLLLILTGLMLMTGFTACGKQNDNGGDGVTPTNTTAAESTMTPDVTETPEATKEPTAEPTEKPAEITEEELHQSPYSSLKEAYADDFLIGTIYTKDITWGNDKDLVLKNFNVVTPENLMKPAYMQPSEGSFHFSESDAMILYAVSNQMQVHGHCLAWHQQSGNWLGVSAANREEAIEQLKNHIYGVAGKYKGKIMSWDVVNEAIQDGASLPANGDWTQCLRETQWTKSIGPDYIALAFQFAREAAPDAILYYNDYNMNNSKKAKIAAAMVADLRSQGVPIDGIGMQGHYTTNTSISSVAASLEMFSKIEGIRISVSELDVGVSGVKSGSLTKAQEMEQAVFYAKLFLLYKDYADVIERVTFWGYKDNTSWRSESAPLLFDSMLQPKEAYYAVLNPTAYAELSSDVKLETKKLEAAYGTPVVDGVKDEIWEQAKAYEISNALFAWQGATGTVRMLWDEQYFYALVEVKDSVLNHSSSNAYEQDSVEIFLDQNNCKKMTYDGSCGQYRCNYMGRLTFGETPTENGVTAKATTTDQGYIVEMQIPLLKAGAKGTVMGFDAQINDASASGARQSVMKLNAITDDAYSNPSMWAEVTFQ